MTVEQKKSRAERLDALVNKHAPEAKRFHDEHGVWPGADADLSKAPSELIEAHKQRLMQADNLSEKAAQLSAEVSDSTRRTAPYVIKTLDDGRTRILLTTDNGSVIGGTGTDIEEALADLESRA